MIAAHIQVLFNKGYIYKKASPKDRRSFYVMPTERALALTDKYNKKQTDYLKALESSIGETEFDQLISLLDKTLPTLEKITEE